MPQQVKKLIEQLSQAGALQHLGQLQRGIEKESLRVSPTGRLSQKPHPITLGSTLTHPKITTDFSESLLELITPVHTGIDDVLNDLEATHQFVYSQLNGETLWNASMPCVLPDNAGIPVAQYGSSNVAKMKTAYRVGLGNRYGRAMQTISGIHYNFSIPDQLWPFLQEQASPERQALSPQDFKSDAYFHLIRNFRRISWLLIYLYGASPAVCKCFLTGRKHTLEEFDKGSFYLPYSTALRMGDLGYQSNAQNRLGICYNSLPNYIQTLKHEITTPHDDYVAMGIKDEHGEHKQLSAALLQIENEFYSSIRPKRVTQSGETPLGALQERGVEYIEVRCIDVNPYLPMGIDANQIRFIDCLLLFCLFDESPLCDGDDRFRIDSNFKSVVNEGRKPGLELDQRQGKISIKDWSHDLFDGIQAIAKQLDKTHGGNDYQRVCEEQLAKIDNPDLTPSAKILADMKGQDLMFGELALTLSKQHDEVFRSSELNAEQRKNFEEAAAHSLAQQQTIEASDSIDFDEYLTHYYQQYQQL